MLIYGGFVDEKGNIFNEKMQYQGSISESGAVYVNGQVQGTVNNSGDIFGKDGYQGTISKSGTIWK